MDEVEAVRLYRIAAEMGFVPAQYNLGVCLQTGVGGSAPDLPGAFVWMQRAADAGDADAQTNVGVALYNGLGAPVDAAAGVSYFRRAAEQGDATAMYNLAGAYEAGKGVNRDLRKGLGWLKRARDAGLPDAGERLAELSAACTPGQRVVYGLGEPALRK